MKNFSNQLPKGKERIVTLDETGNKEAKENKKTSINPRGERKPEENTPQSSPTDVEKEIRKKVIKTIIVKWNNNHPENEVDNSQYNIDSLLNTIANGYITPKAKTQLESFFSEYNISAEKIIDKSSIANLITGVHNKGVQVGAASKNTSTSQTVNILSQQNKELCEAKNALERNNKDLEKENSILQSRIKKMEGDLNMMIKDNEKQVINVEKLTKQLNELQQQINSQSQEHITQLEKHVTELNIIISTAQETIKLKDDAITEEKENVRKLTIQKENLDNKYKTLKDEYDKIDGKHQEEITKLKEAHKEASLRQKEKYEAQLKDKDEVIAKKQSDHETALKDQKDQYEAKYTQQQEESKAALKKKEDDYQKTLEKLKKDQETKVAKLNATIKELGANANVGRDQAIEDAEKLLKTIASDLGSIENSVKAVVNQSPIFVNSIYNILSELQRTQEEFEDYKTEDWGKPEMLQAQVIADMQDIFINALNRSGWMNNVARLLSYSRLPKLHDGTLDGIDLPSKLEAHGISAAVLERIYANMVNLLGIANMGILVPAVLANNYDKESYEYKNDDTWIDKFFPEVSTRNYKGKVFDIVQVGYTVEGVTEKKPVVQYN